MEQMPKKAHVRLIVWFGGLLFGGPRQGFSWPVSLALLVITLVGHIPMAWAEDVVGSIAMDGVPVTITTTVSGQNAVLTFDATSGQRVSLDVPGQSPGRLVSIYRPDGTLITSSSSYWGQFFGALTLEATGTYRIVADLNGTLTGSVTFKLYSVPADVISTITADGVPVVVPITAPGQNGTVTFNGDEGQRILLNVPGSSPPRTVSLYKPDGSLIASSRSYHGQLFDALILPASGAYRIVVDPDAANIGNITLRLYTVPADATGTVSLNGVAAVATTVPGQNASVTFSANAGQRITLNVPGVSPPRQVSLFAPNGTLLVANSGYYGQYFERLTLATTGTYQIFIDPSEVGTGTYTVKLYDLLPDPTAEIGANGVPVVMTTTVPGQNINLTFNGNAGQRISFNVPGVYPPRKVYLDPLHVQQLR